MEKSAELIRAIAVLIWPVAALIFVVCFRTQIAALFGRVKRVRIAGQELDLEKRLDMLATVMDGVAEPTFVPNAPLLRKRRDESLETAAKQPRLALVKLNDEIDRSIRRMGANGGFLQDYVERGGSRLLDQLLYLHEQVLLTAPRIRAIVLYTEIQDAILRSDDGFSAPEMERAVTLGMNILAMVDSAPRQTHAVLSAGAQLFKDRELTELVTGVTGVKIESRTPNDVGANWWPTRSRDYRAGMAVGWVYEANEALPSPLWVDDPDRGVIAINGGDFCGPPMSQFD